MEKTSESRLRIVCRCMGVSSTRVFAAVREGGFETVEQVSKATCAGGGCGTCHEEIEEILADVQGRSVDPTVRMENQLICQGETQGRVEASVDNLIKPELDKHGLSLSGVETNGLDIALHVGTHLEADFENELIEILRLYICPDINVKILP